MSDCEAGGHGDQWAPAARCRRCGHRVAAEGSRPVETRKLPLRYWLFELAARYVARHPVAEFEKSCPACGTGLLADGSCPKGGL